ncbi:glycosyltransferase [Candidatus Magnetominusculus dajiuhuensis]|uniref:glycosyltransferase n=1 Tax=Candidatus Magnetominusculus dajiuhuensis TaxID=3137712 RepID=UPI003B429354
MLRNSPLVYPIEHMGSIDMKLKVKVYLLKQYMKRAFPNADAVIVQTETINRRIRSVYNIRGPIYTVGKNIYQNIQTSGDTGEGNQQVHEICNCGSKMKLLYVTDYYPHKNIERLCEAVALLAVKGIDVTLFLTIDSNGDGNGLIKAIESNKYGKGVINLGHVDHVNLSSVYQCCDAVIMPSHLESFSATYLEAMAFSKPLMVSDLDFAREICADAALYFDPYNVDSIAETVHRLISYPSLGRHCIEKGKDQYKKYNISWDDIAKRYIDIFLKTCWINSGNQTL